MSKSESLLSMSARAMQPSPIRRLAGLVNQPGMISFAGGMPNPATFPDQDLRVILDEIVERDGSRIFQYGVTRGLVEFQDLLKDILTGRGIVMDDSQGLMVTNGSQQGLNLVTQVFVDPGDVILVELPSYVGALACFRNHRAEMVGVDQDDRGIIPEDLKTKIYRVNSQGKKLKLLYLIPNFQNPSGVTISPERRREILTLAAKHGFLVMEDDPYGELYFRGTDRGDIRPVKAFPGGEQVIYLSSFSKVVTPGLRTAFLAGPEWVIEKLELAKQAADLCSSSLDQRLIYEYCKRGLYDEHLGEVRDFYDAKCTVMLQALEKYMPKNVEWTRPKGGMFVWLTLPAGVDAEQLALNAIERCKVAFVHGAPFFVNGEGRNTLRLTFAKEDASSIERGIKLLGEFFSERL
jgi:2-aminoadipate transaminase